MSWGDNNNNNNVNYHVINNAMTNPFLIPQKTKGINRFVVMTVLIALAVAIAIFIVYDSSQDYVATKIEIKESEKLELDWPRKPPFKRVTEPLSSIDFIRMNALVRHNTELVGRYNLVCVAPALYDDDINLFTVKNHTVVNNIDVHANDGADSSIPASHPHEIREIYTVNTYDPYFNCANLEIVPSGVDVTTKFVSVKSHEGTKSRKIKASPKISVSCQLWRSTEIDMSVPPIIIVIDDPSIAYCIQNYFL